jgi:hypothetical protein
MQETNFSTIQGDTLILTVVYKDNTPQKAPINLTGYTAEFQVRDQPGGKIVCATVDTTSGIVINGPTGTITVTIPSNLTKKFTVPQASYQLQINSGTVKTTLATGWIKVSKGIIE